MQNINNVLVRDEHLTSFLNRKVCKKYNHMNSLTRNTSIYATTGITTPEEQSP